MASAALMKGKKVIAKDDPPTECASLSVEKHERGKRSRADKRQRKAEKAVEPLSEKKEENTAPEKMEEKPISEKTKKDATSEKVEEKTAPEEMEERAAPEKMDENTSLEMQKSAPVGGTPISPTAVEVPHAENCAKEKRTHEVAQAERRATEAKADHSSKKAKPTTSESVAPSSVPGSENTTKTPPTPSHERLTSAMGTSGGHEDAASAPALETAELEDLLKKDKFEPKAISVTPTPASSETGDESGAKKKKKKNKRERGREKRRREEAAATAPSGTSPTSGTAAGGDQRRNVTSPEKAREQPPVRSESHAAQEGSPVKSPAVIKAVDKPAPEQTPLRGEGISQVDQQMQASSKAKGTPGSAGLPGRTQSDQPAVRQEQQGQLPRNSKHEPAQRLQVQRQEGQVQSKARGVVDVASPPKGSKWNAADVGVFVATAFAERAKRQRTREPQVSCEEFATGLALIAREFSLQQPS
eukprot:CAMPEP_0195578384 /NCGR_PEP_ID=MMETSP0814-20130614/12001_1 /TAXON_ID=97485 /ORGANISM="Prymnesium parvum, Strain Texoma1" /LENGTH=471 /DNA_ID=CAMNT_0040714909 /DNA_START=53 /DNA_END=1468 /DNA_ORIENTATION=-